MLSQMNPGWNLKIDKTGNDGQRVKLSDCTAYLYIVDAATGWIGAASLRPLDLEVMKASYPAIMSTTSMSSAKLAGAAAGLVATASEAGAKYGDAIFVQAIKGTAFALADTKLFDLVKERNGGYDGHWIYLVYLLKSGERVGRPVFLPDEDNGRFLQTDDLINAARQTIDHDLSNVGGVVQTMIASGNGAVWHELFSPPA